MGGNANSSTQTQTRLLPNSHSKLWSSRSVPHGLVTEDAHLSTYTSASSFATASTPTPSSVLPTIRSLKSKFLSLSARSSKQGNGTVKEEKARREGASTGKSESPISLRGSLEKLPIGSLSENLSTAGRGCVIADHVISEERPTPSISNPIQLTDPRNPPPPSHLSPFPTSFSLPNRLSHLQSPFSTTPPPAPTAPRPSKSPTKLAQIRGVKPPIPPRRPRKVAPSPLSITTSRNVGNIASLDESPHHTSDQTNDQLEICEALVVGSPMIPSAGKIPARAPTDELGNLDDRTETPLFSSTPLTKYISERTLEATTNLTPSTARRWSLVEVEHSYARMKEILGSVEIAEGSVASEGDETDPMEAESSGGIAPLGLVSPLGEVRNRGESTQDESNALPSSVPGPNNLPTTPFLPVASDSKLLKRPPPPSALAPSAKRLSLPFLIDDVFSNEETSSSQRTRRRRRTSDVEECVSSIRLDAPEPSAAARRLSFLVKLDVTQLDGDLLRKTIEEMRTALIQVRAERDLFQEMLEKRKCWSCQDQTKPSSGFPINLHETPATKPSLSTQLKGNNSQSIEPITPSTPAPQIPFTTPFHVPTATSSPFLIDISSVNDFGTPIMGTRMIFRGGKSSYDSVSNSPLKIRSTALPIEPIRPTWMSKASTSSSIDSELPYPSNHDGGTGSVASSVLELSAEDARFLQDLTGPLDFGDEGEAYEEL